jgi:hypothetical protein
MKRKLEVLFGLLLASALMLGGCVASSPDGDDADDDVTVDEAKSALVGAPSAGDPTRSTSGSDPGGGSGSVAKSGTPGMSDPQPTPWKPPPSGPPADPSKEH